MLSVAIYTASFVLATYVVLKAYVYLTQDAAEPPVVSGLIPFISPTFGMATEKAGYYVRMKKKHNHAIYTLRGIGPRLYVVNSRQLIRRIDRHISTVAFTPIQFRGTDKVMGLSPEGLEKVGGDGLLKEHGYYMSFPRMVAPATTPGSSLENLNRAACTVFAASFNKMAAQRKVTVDLLQWTHKEIFNTTNEATYGPQNPFRNPESVKAWYDYEPHILTLLIDFLPNVLARGGLRAREIMAADFKKYFSNGGAEQASDFVKLRHQHNINFGLELADDARTEIGHTIASISNAAPSAFWTIWQIISDPVILADCQDEVNRLVQTDANGNRSIDLAQVQTKCPILVSSWDEVLRFHGTTISARVVKEDTFVDNKYLFKKDSMVMMPNEVIHTDKQLWGPTADKFDHKRFVKMGKDGTLKRAPSANFRGFGSGHVLCPGRHFISSEVLTFVALLIARFDVRPVGGKWIFPGKDKIMNSAFPTPTRKIMVEFVPKDDKKWQVTYTGNSKGLDLTEDEIIASEK